MKAAFTVAGAIRMQGIRLAQPILDKAFGLTGLELIERLDLRSVLMYAFKSPSESVGC